ncbi:carbohydrate ABC transporter substrate-binding protein [Phototrophicus methaneseepsis]|uniref:Carbohydrate ABC transporter substrate-binding protein n=1 Tax=Phototrophicus methaneseepsis TaxID=2710758 RepID=A0A7S8EC52_9CHLR|nr:ABC transporter substrate-binding protein [Phototrophicus methaneseepsis]QPC84023.1 carbohydrate ABC transporter substrate-binding protein [Phototrophicus methaneseepsis]
MKISRRKFLQMTSAGSLGMFLAANGFRLAAQDDAIQIIPSGAELPTADATFRWVDSGDQKAVFWNAFFEKYQEAHPNIHVQYDALPWNEIAQVVPLGVRNGTAHDVFQRPLAVTLAQAVSEGWVAALDDYIPNFAEWKANFPPGVFVEGITGFDGKTYSFPATSNKRTSTHLLYNVEYMQEAGFDPTSGPMSADEFVEVARKITENGAGRYFGFIVGGNQVNRWGDIVLGFARMAGAVCMPVGNFYVDMRTGEMPYTDPLFAEAINVLLRLRDDGSVFPGSLSMNAPEARARMPQGAAGMILQGPWNIPIWLRENPDFNFDIGSQPLLDPDTLIPLTVAPGGDNEIHIYADAPEENKQIAGDIFHYLGTLEGQIAWATYVGAADPAIFAEAIEVADMHELERKALLMFNEQIRVGPSPIVRNQQTADVALELRAVTPSLPEIIQGIYTEQITDIAGALQDLSDRCNAELDRAIAAAQEKGAEVSRDDYVFPNWDPTADYSEENYADLT